VVLCSVDTSSAAIEHAVALAPDAIILDLLAACSLELAKSLSVRLPAAKIVAFAVRDSDREVLACAEAGIAAFVPPEASQADLLAALEHALRGELYCSPRVAALLYRHVASRPPAPPPLSDARRLTRRELQILGLLEHGMSNKQIARSLRIGGATVKNHVHHILEKLHVHRRGEAAAWLRAAQPRQQTPPPIRIPACD
jgi:DNA-binding NarL/FixJ family response regulator